MRDLKITLIQTEPVWEDIKGNLAIFDEIINNISEETDLIILPEMFTTGFSMNASSLAQDINGSSINWLQNKSRQINADIVGSIIFKNNSLYFNRLLWAKPDGRLFTYDKKHLFRFAGEEKVYSEGIENITVELNDWKIRPFICYDLRFPAWTRNINNQYDIAIFIANWPEKRSMHWKSLLQARAIENQCYVIGVNRVGTDGNGLFYSGDSSIIDPLGKIIFHKNNEECTYTTVLSFNILEEYRKTFPAWRDADIDMINFP
ncbi:MAG: amidohydrolase [Deltaproteobacteria bacterium]|nr:amidohydrolase [Deltaproteobacteria bacterium]MBW2564054.1 amidohydrolase [Deltaproteobacteria bacterium]